MKRLGVLFILLLSFSLFLLPNKSYAAISETDLSRWKGYLTSIEGLSAEEAKIMPMYIEIFNKLADKTYSIYKNDKNILPSQTLQFIRGGHPTPRDGQVEYGSSIVVSLDDLIESERKYGKDHASLAQKVFVESRFWVQKEAINDNPSISQETKITALQNAEDERKKSLTIINNTPKDCENLFFGGFWCNVDQSFTNFIKLTLLNFAGFFLWMSANLLNFAIKISILNFSDWAGPGLYPLWQTMRQIISLCVVFAGVYIAFMYIINQNENFIKKYIPWLVVFALFVNFSYPITRAAIDISNIISLNLYTQSVGAGALTGNEKNTAGAIIMSKMGLQDLVMSVGNTGTVAKGFSSQLTSTPSALLAVVFVFYAAYIFGFAAILMIIRTVVLVFIIIGSPILFIDSVVPKAGEWAGTVRKLFYSQLAVSIVFMIALYFSVSVMNIFSNLKNIEVLSTTKDISMFFNILLMLIMLHIMLKVTKEVSGSIGQVVESFYKTAAVGVAGGLAFGGAGMLGRATLGRAAAGFAESKWMKDNEGGYLGGKLMGMTKNLSNNTFDARNTTAVQKLSGMGGVKLDGNKGSYSKNMELKQKNFATRYGQMNDKAKQEFANRHTGTNEDSLGGKFSRAVSFTTDRTNVAMPTLQEEALTANKAQDGYNKRSGEARQEHFNKQSSSSRNIILANEEVKSQKVDEKLDQYKKLSGKAKQAYYETQTDDVKTLMKDYDLKTANPSSNWSKHKQRERLLRYSIENNSDIRHRMYEQSDDETKEKMREMDETMAIAQNTPAANNPNINQNRQTA